MLAFHQTRNYGYAIGQLRINQRSCHLQHSRTTAVLEQLFPTINIEDVRPIICMASAKFLREVMFRSAIVGLWEIITAINSRRRRSRLNSGSVVCGEGLLHNAE